MLNWKKAALFDEHGGPEQPSCKRAKIQQTKDSWKRPELENDEWESIEKDCVQHTKRAVSWKKATLDETECQSVTSWKTVALDDDDLFNAVSTSQSGMMPNETEIMVVVNITTSLLSILPQEGKGSVYSENGLDKKRVANVLKSCRCRVNCKRNLSMAQVMPLLKIWHGLAISHQTAVLTSLYFGGGDDMKKRRRWALEGRAVCFDGFCSVLGHAPRSILRMLHGEEDRRTTKSAVCPRAANQRMVCNHFFMEQYMSCAEDLPEVAVTVDVDKEIATAAETEPSTQYCKHFVWMLESPVPDRIAALLHDPEAPTRTLPPGQVTDLWHQFLVPWSYIVLSKC